jgi:hypothetical protein
LEIGGIRYSFFRLSEVISTIIGALLRLVSGQLKGFRIPQPIILTIRKFMSGSVLGKTSETYLKVLRTAASFDLEEDFFACEFGGAVQLE